MKPLIVAFLLILPSWSALSQLLPNNDGLEFFSGGAGRADYLIQLHELEKLTMLSNKPDAVNYDVVWFARQTGFELAEGEENMRPITGTIALRSYPHRAKFPEVIAVFPHWGQNTLNYITHNASVYKSFIRDIQAKCVADSKDVRSKGLAEKSFYRCRNVSVGYEKIDSLKPAAYLFTFSLSTPSSRMLVEQGRLALRANDLASAMDHLAEAISMDSLSHEAYYLLGSIYFQRGLFDMAVRHFDRVIRIKQDHDHAYEMRGRIYLESNQFYPALRDLNRAIELNPSHAESYYYRGIANLSIEQEEGEAHLDSCRDFRSAVDLGHEEARNWIESFCGK